MPAFHETKYMRNYILSHQNLTYDIRKATDIVIARIFDWGGPNHNSLAMVLSELFTRGTFCGTRICKVKDH